MYIAPALRGDGHLRRLQGVPQVQVAAGTLLHRRGKDRKSVRQTGGSRGGDEKAVLGIAAALAMLWGSRQQGRGPWQRARGLAG